MHSYDIVLSLKVKFKNDESEIEVGTIIWPKKKTFFLKSPLLPILVLFPIMSVWLLCIKGTPLQDGNLGSRTRKIIMVKDVTHRQTDNFTTLQSRILVISSN